MSIYKRGAVWWIKYYVKVNGKLEEKRESTGCIKKGDAQAYEGKIRAAKKENRLFDIKKEYTHTFNELLERYRVAFQNQKSFKDKKYHFTLFEKIFSGNLLAEITLYDIEKFRNERKDTPVKSAMKKVKEGFRIREKHPTPPRERRVATVNRELSTLRHMLSKAVEWGMMESSPFMKVKKLFYKENNQRVRFLTEIEEIRLLKKCIGYLKHIVTVALNTGMRKGEILSLKWAQIRNDFIYLTETKTEKARQIPINDTLRELFNSIPRHLKSDYVFLNPLTGMPYKAVIRSFNTAVRRAGIEDFHFHDLRHTFASKLVMKGYNLKIVQELLGHTDIKMTMRYAHLAEKSLVDAVKALDEKKEKVNRHNLGTVAVSNMISQPPSV